MKISERFLNKQQAFSNVKLPDRYIPFKEWGPDYSPLNTEGLYRALNVIPVPNGLGPMPALVEQTNALDDRCYGGIAADDGAGSWLFYAGTERRLYVGTAAEFQDVGQILDYNLQATDQWKFTEWGTFVLATNVSDPLQVIDATKSDPFKDAITFGSRKPSAKYMAVIADRLVLANTFDNADDSQKRRIWWGPLGDFDNFDPDPSTGANYVDLLDGGVITGISGGKEFGLVFQNQRISRIDPTGGSTIFQISPLDQDRGCPFPNTIVPYGRWVFFLSEDGVHYNDGSYSTNISYGKVQRQLWKLFNSNKPNDLSASIDRRNNLFLLAVPQSKVKTKRLFIYNMLDGRWTEAELDIELLIQFRKLGTTLDQMTDRYPRLDTDVPFSLDDGFWKGGRLESGAFNSNHILSTFTGVNQQVSVVTNLFTGKTGEGIADKSTVNRAWPMIHGQQLGNMRLIRRNELYRDDTAGSTPLVGPFVVIDRGRTRFIDRNEARYHQLELFIPEGAAWDMIEGVNVEMTRIGGRIG